MSRLIKLRDLATDPETKWWPYSEWQTGHLIRTKKLGAVRVGRRVFVTPELLAEFVDNHTARAPLKQSGDATTELAAAR